MVKAKIGGGRSNMGGSRDKETRFGLKGLRFKFLLGSSSGLVTVWPHDAIFCLSAPIYGVLETK